MGRLLVTQVLTLEFGRINNALFIADDALPYICRCRLSGTGEEKGGGAVEGEHSLLALMFKLLLAAGNMLLITQIESVCNLVNVRSHCISSQ